MTDKYAVIGNPIEHSKSPLIHTMFAGQTRQDISYEAILAPLNGFAATVERLRKEEYKGCNVTVPFKFEAFDIALHLTPRVLAAKAVNTLSFKNNEIYGDNTDGVGLVRDIERNLGISLKGKHVLLMGAGGAAWGIQLPLLMTNIQTLVAVNRTKEKAD
jgi:shikimate dehydrogenase